MFQTTNLSEMSICFYCQILQMMGIQGLPILPMPRFPPALMDYSGDKWWCLYKPFHISPLFPLEGGWHWGGGIPIIFP